MAISSRGDGIGWRNRRRIDSRLVTVYFQARLRRLASLATGALIRKG